MSIEPTAIVELELRGQVEMPRQLALILEKCVEGGIPWIEMMIDLANEGVKAKMPEVLAQFGVGRAVPQWGPAAQA